MFSNKSYRSFSLIVTGLLLIVTGFAGGASHDPIHINGNSNFTAGNGVSNPGAAGTEQDPFIIENWEIVLDASDTAPGILIENTTAHFIVRNCTVRDGDLCGEQGINLNNVSNGTIDSCTSVNNRRAGIHLIGSDHCTVSNNECSDNIGNAIGVWLENGSHYNTIVNNTCNRVHTGMYFGSADHNLIKGNTCTWNSSLGLQLRYSTDYNRVEGNTCSYNGRVGLQLANNPSHNLVIGNTCNYNGQNDVSSCGGIWLWEAGHHNMIWGNYCKGNVKGGGSGGITFASIYHGVGQGNVVAFNTLVENGTYGLCSSDALGNYIHHNNFIDNNNPANTNDDNIWDNSYPSGGNYWKDYSGVDNFSGPNQNIPGSDGIGDTNFRDDRYPLIAMADPNSIRASSVENAPASDITGFDANLNGILTFEGYEFPVVKIYWGDNDGGTNPDNWDHCEILDSSHPGAFSVKIADLTIETTYYYRCFCSDYTGTDWADATGQFTTEGAEPPTVINAPAANINFSSATLNGEVTDNGNEIPTVTIYWGDNDGGTIAENWDYHKSIGFKNGAFYLDVVNLQPDTLHYFRCYASNSAGGSWAASTAQFTTALPPDPPVVSNLPASDIFGSSARFNGQVTDTGGDAPVVYIYWGDNDGGTVAENWDNCIDGGLQGAGPFYEDITGLTEQADYYYRCYAVNYGGGAWAGSTASFSTLPWTWFTTQSGNWDVQNASNWSNGLPTMTKAGYMELSAQVSAWYDGYADLDNKKIQVVSVDGQGKLKYTKNDGVTIGKHETQLSSSCTIKIDSGTWEPYGERNALRLKTGSPRVIVNGGMIDDGGQKIQFRNPGGTLDQNGGVIKTNQIDIFDNSPGAQVTLSGGRMEIGSSGLDLGNQLGAFNITDDSTGVIILEGNKLGSLDNYRQNGQLLLDGGSFDDWNSFNVYDHGETFAGKTTVQWLPYQGDLDLNGVVDFRDFEKFSLHWPWKYSMEILEDISSNWLKKVE